MCTVPLTRTIDCDWVRRLVAEQLVTIQTKRGFAFEWEKSRERNEALDCRVYPRAAA